MKIFTESAQKNTGGFKLPFQPRILAVPNLVLVEENGLIQKSPDTNEHGKKILKKYNTKLFSNHQFTSILSKSFERFKG